MAKKSCVVCRLVLIEFDDIDWTRREWVRIHDIFQLFLVEHTLVWAERPDPDKPKQSISWPGLSFRAVVDKVGLSGCKRKPVEFLVDRFLGLVEEKEIQIFQEGDEETHPVSVLRGEVHGGLKEWLDYQNGQKILLTTPTVLVGYRLEVYRAEGTTQWYTAVIQSYNHTSKTLSVTDDTVLEEHNEDPTLIQMHLIDDGVVDSILRGVEIGGIAPRRRQRAVKQDKEQQSTATKPIASGNQTPVNRSAITRKSRTPQQQQQSQSQPLLQSPPPSQQQQPQQQQPQVSLSALPVSTPSTPPAAASSSPVQELPAEKPESKSAEKFSLRQRPLSSKDRKRRSEPELSSSEETKASSPVSTKRRNRLEETTTTRQQTNTRTPASVKTESTTVVTNEPTPPVRVSPRNTPAKEKVKLQRTREIDKQKPVPSGKETPESQTKSADNKPSSPAVSDSDSPINRGKIRSRTRREEKVSDSADSPRSRSETLRQRNDSPRSRSSSQTPTQEAESVIKPVNKSGSNITKAKDRKSERKSERRVSNCAKKDRDLTELGEENTSSTDTTGKESSQSTDSSSKVAKSEASKTGSVETEVDSVKGRETKEKDPTTTVKEGKVESVSPPRVTCEVKPTKAKEKRRNKDTTPVETTQKCGGKSSGENSANKSKEAENCNESGDMHFIKKKQSLISGSGAPSGAPNNRIPAPNLDLNQSVTDQIARAEKLSHLNGDDRVATSSVLSSGSEQLTDHEHESLSFHKDTAKHNPSSVTSSGGPANANWSQDERSQSRNSEERCSSGFSDECRRPSSRLDERKSLKNSPASSPLIVDKKEPVQIYRDPILMSKNPVRSNVPSMHNSHKPFTHTVHNPIPTPATRPASAGMSSTPMTSSLERTSRTPVVPSASYVNPLQGPLGASLASGTPLAGLLPHGLPQIDPIAMQQFAVQQHQVAAALASQYSSALSMSYPPRGSLNSAQLEHLWQQKYPHVPVPPPWLLAKHQEDLIRDVRLLHEQEMEREHIERMERLERERERDLREREQRERKERERRERERQEKERLDRERREREKLEQERAERERLEREKHERAERERRERERLEREHVERSRILKESVDSHAAVDQHFTESLRLAQQRAAQTGMWPTASITLGTGKPKTEAQSQPSSYKPGIVGGGLPAGAEKSGEIKPSEKIKQEQLREADYRHAEMMRKHQEMMSQQEEYLKQQMYHKRQEHAQHKPDVKPTTDKDLKPNMYAAGFPGKREPGVGGPPGSGSVKQEGPTANFSLYGYQPDKYSLITTDQLHNYELDKIKHERGMVDTKLGVRSPSPRKKDMSVPPPLIKDTKPHSSVIVENKLKEGMMKSPSPHSAQQYAAAQAAHMSPHQHQHPRPAHTPERSHERPSPNSSSPGSSAHMNPTLAHSHHHLKTNSRSQSPLCIASPQQLSTAVMQPMDYRCSPASKSRGSPGSSASPQASSTPSSMGSPPGGYTAAIAQPPTSLPQSSVAFTYSLIQQGLVPNPIYTNNGSSVGKGSDSQRTVSVTGTAHVPRASHSPVHGGGNGPQHPHPQQQQQQSAIAQGTKRKGPKEGNDRKRKKGTEGQGGHPGNNNPLNLSVPVTTPQILTNQSPYTTSSTVAMSTSASPLASTTSTTQSTPTTTSSQTLSRLSNVSGFMDSFKSFVENTVQNAFMSDPELAKPKEGGVRRTAQEQLQQMHQLHMQQQQQQAGCQPQQHKSQAYKPKTSLERSCTPVTSQNTSSTASTHHPSHSNSNNPAEDASNLNNSGNTSSSGLSYSDSINRVANGQVDTDSDTLSAPSPPPHLRHDNNNPSPHKSAKHPNLKKAWLQRHCVEDKQEGKAGSNITTPAATSTATTPAASTSPVTATPTPTNLTAAANSADASNCRDADKDKEKDKGEQVKNCYVNCSYISPSREGGSKSPIRHAILPNGAVEKQLDELTTSASETEQATDSAASYGGSRKRNWVKKERGAKKAKVDPQPEPAKEELKPVTQAPVSNRTATPVTNRTATPTPPPAATTNTPSTRRTATPTREPTPPPPTQQGKKKSRGKNKDTKSKVKNNSDTISDEQIKKIVENCKDSVKEKEQQPKPTEEAYDKNLDAEDSRQSHADSAKSDSDNGNKTDTKFQDDEEATDEAMDMGDSVDAMETSETESSRRAERSERRERKKKERKEKKKKDRVRELREEEEDDEEEERPSNMASHTPPPPILKETELKTQQSTTFSKPLVRVPVSVLRKTGEPFMQDGSCSEVTPKLMKCRECKMTPTQRGKTVPNIFCRFYAFRRLKYSQRGFVSIDGFSELSDAEQDDIDPWIPTLPIIEPKIEVEAAKFIMSRIGDRFCELVQQEREAQMQALEADKKIAWKRAVTGVREMCDVCDTTLFNMHWVCHKCGFVVCLDCYKVRVAERENNEDEDKTDSEGEEEGRGDKGDGSGSEDGNPEHRKWLTCSANRQPHEEDKLMLTQIIPSDALWEVGRMLHEVRERWNISRHCPCSPKLTKKNGVKTDLVEEAMKQMSPKKKLVNGVGEEKKTKNGNIKTAVYHPDSSSPLSLLADVASMDSEKTIERSESPFSKKEKGKHGKSYSPITEPVSPGSSEKKMPASCSTLRELLTKTAGKVKNNTECSKKKAKNTSSLDDIIKKVVEKQIPKEGEKTGNVVKAEPVVKLLHYTPRLGVSHMLVRETPILIHNLTETSVLYPDVPHSWLCDGRLLRLHDSRHKGNLKIFMEQWRRGQPVLVSGVDKFMNQTLWQPQFFSKQFGELENDLINCRTGCVVVGQPMKHFWDGFGCMQERLVDEEGLPMLLKLKDWPPSDDFSDVLPEQFQDLMRALPLPEYTRRDGRLNLVSRLPDFLVKPDLGPKMYIAYGSAQYPNQGTTNLHLDVSDAANVMVYVGYLDNSDGARSRRSVEEKDADALRAIDMAQCDTITKRRIREVHETPGALWHIFDAVDADKIRDFLNKVAKERGEKIELHHDPIHDQSWYLDEELRERLAREYAVHAYTIIQCLGDTIFIPAGAPHQVRNLNNCIKVAEDFVSPENIPHCFRLTQEFRHLSSGHSNHEDKLQVKNIIYHAIKDAVAVMNKEDPDDYED